MARDIVIIGGGIAGLTCARYLANHPERYRVTLLEAEGETGGQARAFELDGETAKGRKVTVEHGSHVFFNFYSTITGLIGELRRDPELGKDMPAFSRVHGWTIVDAKGERATLAQSKWLPSPINVVPSIARIPWLSISERLRICIGSAVLLTKSFDEFDELDTMTSWELGTKCGYGEGGLTAWNSASLGLTNLFVREQSGAIFCAKHKVLIQYEDGLDYQLPAGNLGHIFARPMEKKIRSMGVTVRTGCDVAAIDRGAGEEKTRVSFIERGEARELFADQVVLAVKAQDAAKLCTWVDARWKELEPVTPVVTIVVGLSGVLQQSMDDRELGLSRDDWSFSVVTDLSHFWPEFAPDLAAGKTVLRCEIGHADLLPSGVDTSDAEIVALVAKDLARLFPEMERKKIAIEWHRLHRETKHLYTRWTKGQFAKKPKERDVGKGVYLAGDWTTKGTIGMEAAANSGIEAASFVLSQDGLPPIPFRDVPL